MSANVERKVEVINSVLLAKDLIGRLSRGEIARVEPCSDPYGDGKPCDKIRNTGCGYEDGPLYNPDKGIVECPLQRGSITIVK